MSANAETDRIIIDEEIEDDVSTSPEAPDDSDTDPSENEDTSDTTSDDSDTLLDDSASEEEEEGEELVEGDPVATPPKAAATAPTTEPKPQSSDPLPFTYRGDKAEHAFDGAHYYPGDGAYFSEKSIPELKRRLAKAENAETYFRQSQAELRELREGRSETDEQADAIAEYFAGVVNAKDEDEVIEEALTLFRNRRDYQIAIKEKALERREQKIEQRFQPTPEEVEAEHAEIAETGYSDSLDQIFQMPFASVLNEDDRAELREDLTSKKRSLLRRATRDVPEMGLQKGEIYYDGAELLPYVQQAAKIIQRKAGASVATSKAADINRKRTGANAQLPPSPTAQAAKRQPTRDVDQPRDTAGRFADREEWTDFMNSGLTREQWEARKRKK